MLKEENQSKFDELLTRIQECLLEQLQNEIQECSKEKLSRIGNHLVLANSLASQALMTRVAILKDLALTLVTEFEAIEALIGSQSLDFKGGINIQEELIRYESALIKSALEITGGNQRRAAALLGLRASTLVYRIKRCQIKLKSETQTAPTDPHQHSLSRSLQTLK